jgi:DNA-binding NarL/FixJ family response regulator
MSIAVLIADDHAMMREGLRSILERAPGGDIRVVAEAPDGRAVLKLVAEREPDVVIMDVALPGLNGIETTRRLGTAHPRVRVIALSTHADKRFVMAMLEAGALGYVVKEAAGADLIRAIRSAMLNQVYLSPKVATGVAESAVALARRSDAELTGSALGGREREVLQLIAEGKTSKRIASTLAISVNTVEAHRRNIMRKLGLHSVAELTKYAIREGLTSAEP